MPGPSPGHVPHRAPRSSPMTRTSARRSRLRSPRAPADARLGDRRRLVRRRAGVPDRLQRPRGVGHHGGLHGLVRSLLAGARQRTGGPHAVPTARSRSSGSSSRSRCAARPRSVEEVLVTRRGPIVTAVLGSGLSRARLSIRACGPRQPWRVPGFLGAQLARDFETFRGAFRSWPGPSLMLSSMPTSMATSAGSWSGHCRSGGRGAGCCRYRRGRVAGSRAPSVRRSALGPRSAGRLRRLGEQLSARGRRECALPRRGLARRLSIRADHRGAGGPYRLGMSLAR